MAARSARGSNVREIRLSSLGVKDCGGARASQVRPCEPVSRMLFASSGLIVSPAAQLALLDRQTSRRLLFNSMGGFSDSLGFWQRIKKR